MDLDARHEVERHNLWPEELNDDGGDTSVGQLR